MQRTPPVKNGWDVRLRIACADALGIEMWSVASRRRQFTVAYRGGASAVTFSRDGKRLVVSGARPKAFDSANGRSIRWPHPLPAADHLCFSPDRQSIAGATTGGKDAGQIRIWEAETGRESTSFAGHPKAVTALTYSPDGKRLASGGIDGAIKLWDLHSGQELLTLQAHERGCLSLAFSPDGLQLASGGSDGIVKIWDARPLSPNIQSEREALNIYSFYLANGYAAEEMRRRAAEETTLNDAARERLLSIVDRTEPHEGAESCD